MWDLSLNLGTLTKGYRPTKLSSNSAVPSATFNMGSSCLFSSFRIIWEHTDFILYTGHTSHILNWKNNTVSWLLRAWSHYALYERRAWLSCLLQLWFLFLSWLLLQFLTMISGLTFLASRLKVAFWAPIISLRREISPRNSKFTSILQSKTTL